MSNRWEQEEIELLKYWYEEGWLDEEIGLELNRTPKAISRKREVLNLIGIRKIRYTEEDKLKLKIFCTNGVPLLDISKKLNRSIDSIKRQISNLGLLHFEIVKRNTEDPNQEYIIEGDGKRRKASRILCSICGVSFLRHSRNIKEKNYCSKECGYMGRKRTIVVQCAHCKKDIERSPSKLKNSKSGLYFCNRECKEEAQKYMKEIQPSHYGTGTGIFSYRKKAFKAYGKKCVICAYDNADALEVHHIDKNRDNNDVKNLKVLCANCHTLIHKGKITGEWA